MKQYSIKRQLIVAVVSGCMLVLLIAAVFLDVMINIEMQEAFDSGLLEKARALGLIVEHEDAGLVFEMADEMMPEFMDGQNPQYFQILLGEGLVLKRSRSLKGGDLPRFQTSLHQQTLSDIALPDGRPGRLVEIAFVPRFDAHSDTTASDVIFPGDPGNRHVTLTLARERVTLQKQEFVIRVIIGGALLLTLLGIAVLVQKFVSSGLLPLELLATQVKNIDEGSLDRRLTHQGPQSVELAPVEDQLNSLLGRLEAAFQREKRFSADVAHELRTPLAELKALAEVGMLKPADRQTVLAFFGDVKDVSVRMEATVGVLLELARADAGQLQIVLEDTHVAALVDSVWSSLEHERQANKQLLNEVPEHLQVRTDREKLELILRNLLVNAADYSPAGSIVRVFTTQSQDNVELGIENRAIDLDAADLPLMRDRFWRKERARSDAEHSGLGLAVVEALADALALRVRLGLDEQQVFRVLLQGLRAPWPITENDNAARPL